MSGSRGKPRSKLAAAAGNRPKGGITDEWLTVDEVCRIIKIGRRTFERYLSRGTGPRIKRLAEMVPFAFGETGSMSGWMTQYEL
jgi:hypothetical protein